MGVKKIGLKLKFDGDIYKVTVEEKVGWALKSFFVFRKARRPLGNMPPLNGGVCLPKSSFGQKVCLTPLYPKTVCNN